MVLTFKRTPFPLSAPVGFYTNESATSLGTRLVALKASSSFLALTSKKNLRRIRFVEGDKEGSESVFMSRIKKGKAFSHWRCFFDVGLWD